MLLHFLWETARAPFVLWEPYSYCSFSWASIMHTMSSTPAECKAYWEGFCVSPQVYLGVRTFPQYGRWYVTVVAATRLLSFAGLDIDSHQEVQPEMTMHLYAFGSVCRGDINYDLDIDLLALVSGHDARLNPAEVFHLFSCRR